MKIILQGNLKANLTVTHYPTSLRFFLLFVMLNVHKPMINYDVESYLFRILLFVRIIIQYLY